MRNSTRTTPRFTRLARLAEAQYGVVSTDQLLALGFSRATISRWTAEGRLHRIHRGVYAVGHKRLSVEGRWMAAVLSCGKGAVLSHLTAAAHWDFLRTDASRIDVTVPIPRRLAARRRVRVHRSRLDPDERTLRHGIPVTSPMRTMLDLAEAVPPNRVRHALEASVRRGKYDRDRMHAVIARGEGRRGLKVLRRLLAELDDDLPEFRSPLEPEFHDLLRANGLPLPSTNVVVEGETVDCYWPAHGLVVELDSYGHHRSREQFERERTEKLQNAGLTVRRFTRDGVRGSPDRVVSSVRKALGLG